MSSALPCTTIRRLSGQRSSTSTKWGLISIASSRASGCIARSSARVVPPVPGPSSTTSLARCARVARVTRRSRKRELGMIDPTCFGPLEEAAEEGEAIVGLESQRAIVLGHRGSSGKRARPGA